MGRGSLVAPIEVAPLMAAGNAATRTGLKKAAQEFESMLLSNLLESMKQGFGGEEESQDAGHSAFSNMGTQALAQAVVARGGIGIAKLMLGKLQNRAANPG